MTIEAFIKKNFQLNTFPVEGSSFITPNGKFVCLRRANYDHEKLLNTLKNNGIIGTDNEFRELRKKGYIRLNDGVDTAYPYVKVYDRNPTAQQYKALELYDIHLKSKKRERLTVIFDTEKQYLEEDFFPYGFINEIKHYYAVEKYKNLITNHIDGEVSFDWYFGLDRKYNGNRIVVKDGLTTLIFVGFENYLSGDIARLCSFFDIDERPKILVEEWLNVPVFSFNYFVENNLLKTKKEIDLHVLIKTYTLEDYAKKTENDKFYLNLVQDLIDELEETFGSD